MKTSLPAACMPLSFDTEGFAIGGYDVSISVHVILFAVVHGVFHVVGVGGIHGVVLHVVGVVRVSVHGVILHVEVDGVGIHGVILHAVGVVGVVRSQQTDGLLSARAELVFPFVNFLSKILLCAQKGLVFSITPALDHAERDALDLRTDCILCGRCPYMASTAAAITAMISPGISSSFSLTVSFSSTAATTFVSV